MQHSLHRLFFIRKTTCDQKTNKQQVKQNLKKRERKKRKLQANMCKKLICDLIWITQNKEMTTKISWLI